MNTMHLLCALGTFIKPLALKLYEDQYHLFYLFSPTNQDKDKSVGHAISKDMINWEHKSVVILNTENYYPLGIYCDKDNNLNIFNDKNSSNLIVIYTNQSGDLCINYWNKSKDTWPLIDNISLPFLPEINGKFIGIGSDSLTKTQAVISSDNRNLTLHIYCEKTNLHLQTLIDSLQPQNVKSVRIDITPSAQNNDTLIILVTALIHSSNEKIYIQYRCSSLSLTEETRVGEQGTSGRMLSLISGRIIEFGVSDTAKGLIALPREVYMSSSGMTRGEPLELLNYFSNSFAIEPGPFRPIAKTFILTMNCHQLKARESITLSLFGNQAPLLTINKLQAGYEVQLKFGYDSEDYRYKGTVTKLELFVDNGIVELRHDSQPGLILNFDNVSSTAAAIAIFPPQVEMKIASMLPEIKNH